MKAVTMFDEKMCRLCLKSTEVTMKIFTANIPDIIETLTSIKVKENDGFPSMSCKSCISDLYAAYETRNRIIESERLLKSKMVLLSTQKEESNIQEKTNSATQSSECEPKIEVDELFIKQDQNEDENEHSQETTKSATQSSVFEPKIEIDELFIKQDQNEDENEHSQETTKCATESSVFEPKIEIAELFIKQNQDEDENEHSVEQEKDKEEVDAIDDFIFGALDDDDPMSTETNQEKSDSYIDNEQKSSNYNTDMINKEKDVMLPGWSVSSKDYEVSSPESDNKHLKAECKSCDAIVRKDNIGKHYMLHKRGPQICYICGSQCKSIESFRQHMFYYHKNKKLYKCEHCDAQFLTSTTLSAHRKRLHIGERRHQCEQCGRAFFAPIALKKHRELVHLGLRPYPCDFCSKRFCSTYALKTHRRQHTGELPYTCGVCTAGFKQAVSLRTHMKSKHNIIVKANKPGQTYTQQAKWLMKVPSENYKFGDTALK